MKALWIFASIYLLIAVVACQPLRDAMTELELGTKAHRRRSMPHDRGARTGAPKKKRVSRSLYASSD